MPFKFKDLIVTIVPRGRVGLAASGGPGCDAGCTANSGSVGSCTSECGVQCFDSGEIVEMFPYRWIDPEYQLELRQLLIYGLIKSEINVPRPIQLQTLESQMRPQSLEEIEALEVQLTGALQELRQQKLQYQPKGGGCLFGGLKKPTKTSDRD